MTKRRAFTLIELLVVTAIILVPAAILFPVFARAREQARKAACMSNLKQIGLGIMMYVQDYNETYPVAERYTGNTGGTVVSWYDVLPPFTKSNQIFICPTANQLTRSGGYGWNMAGLKTVSGCWVWIWISQQSWFMVHAFRYRPHKVIGSG